MRSALGVLDISLYRDDFEHLHENPKLQEQRDSVHGGRGADHAGR